MLRLNEAEVEWALKHLRRFYSSDFFPQLFEFEILTTDWPNIKQHLLDVDLSVYVPKTPLTLWAPKKNGIFRCVHQLEPLDSIVYTALVKQQTPVFEAYQIAQSEGVAYSYRLDPDLDGSFFASSEDGWSRYYAKTSDLIAGYPNGIVVICDFVEFYREIYTRRLRDIIIEAGGVALEEYANVLENFLRRLYTETLSGLPVGPAPSIVLAELILADIDRKIRTYTSSFVRWVDNFWIFFERAVDAEIFLHNFARYLHGVHRLAISSDKTRLVRVGDFKQRFFRRQKLMQRLTPQSGMEEPVDEDEVAARKSKLHAPSGPEILADTYSAILSEQLKYTEPNFVLLKTLFKYAARYHIRSILKAACKHLERFLPVVREVSLYVRSVVDRESAKSVGDDLCRALQKSAFLLPYPNLWIAHILQDEAFNNIDLSTVLYAKIVSLRDQALIARRRGDWAWLNANKDGINDLGFWERRAILYAASALPPDEKENWLNVASKGEDKLESALRTYMRS